MVEIGKFNSLKVIKEVEFGVYLDGDDLGEILLPKRYLPEDQSQPLIDTEMNVFLYYDSEDRLIATTEVPYAQVGEFAVLEVAATSPVGAFLDWGLPKDLFLPFAEQSRPLGPGQKVVVFLYLDKSFRISSSMRIDRNISKDPIPYRSGDAVDLIVVGKTDLGYKAIINKKFLGMLFSNEVFQPLNYGQEIKGYIKNIRPDGKVDLLLTKQGHQAGEEIEPVLLDMLKENNGFLDITDKTDPKRIYDLFGVSKKKFKIALSGLYKKRVIEISDEGIRLVKK